MASSTFMGIESKVIQDCLKTEEYQKERAALKKVIGDRKAIVSVAFMERLKGLPLQLQAISNLLNKYPSLQQTLVFVIVGLFIYSFTSFIHSFTHSFIFIPSMQKSHP